MITPGRLTIVSPIHKSPAEQAGLLGGDVIISANGTLITPEMTLQQAVNYIKGPAGTQVLLQIERDKKILEISVTRAVIEIPEITHNPLAN